MIKSIQNNQKNISKDQNQKKMEKSEKFWEDSTERKKKEVKSFR